jgi:hypothetical protein
MTDPEIQERLFRGAYGSTHVHIHGFAHGEEKARKLEK